MNENENQEILPGLAPRVVLSIIVFFGLLIFAIIYVAFFATSFSLVQKIAIIVVSLLLGAAILGVMWISWGLNLEKK